MASEKYIPVGKLGKPHKLSGAFRFLLYEELKSKKQFPKYFMIEQRGTYIPWFVKKTEWLGFNDGFIEFEEITSVEKAKPYINHELLLIAKDYDVLFKKNAGSISYLVGYTAKEEEVIGIITEVIENPGQLLCLVKREDGEIYIPLVEEFISKIDKRKKEIIFNLPEGLLDL